MAIQTTYSIGQYRSKSDNNKYVVDWLNKVEDAFSGNSTIDTGTVDVNDAYSGSVASMGVTSTQDDIETHEIIFRDKALKLKDTVKFDSNKMYFVRLKILRNEAHNMTYNIKLVNLIKNENGGNKIQYFCDSSENFQLIKRILVERGSLQNLNSVVSLVVGKVGMKNEKPVLTASIIDDKNQHETTIKESGGKYKYNNKEISEYSSIVVDVSEIYRDKTQEEYYDIVEILFRPKSDSFNGILIEKERRQIDYNTQFIDKYNNERYSGLYTDAIVEELYEVKNLLATKHEDNREIPLSYLDKIGIWGHPGMCFSINGEEIHIGSRGYYELNIEDYKITELGAIVRDQEDKFLIDYEYNLETER